MPVNYDAHEFAAEPTTETRDRFVRSAMWNGTPANRAAVAAAFDRLAVMLPGSSLNVTMYQYSPSGQRTRYALVLHRGPRADQRRYFRPDAVVAAYEWEVKRGNRVPAAEVVDALRQMESLATNA
jgi:hypothetical protein